MKIVPINGKWRRISKSVNFDARKKVTVTDTNA